MRFWLPVAGALAILLAAAWTFWPRENPSVGVAAPLPQAVEVRTVEKIIERPKIVYVYPDKVKQDLGLPADHVADVSKKVIATGKLDADDRPYTLSAVLDIETGDSKVFARPDPLPWIGPGRRGALGIAHGAGDVGVSTKIYAYHGLLQVKALHAGARAEVDQRGEWWAGGYVEYRW